MSSELFRRVFTSGLSAHKKDTKFIGMGLRFIQVLTWISCLTAVSQEQNTIYERELDENMESNLVTGILDASRDAFTRAVSFDFSQVFFKRRSLGSEQRSVLLNGVPMNKMDDGRANWSNWGGLNDALRNQEIVQGILPWDFYMGKMGGTVNINSLARLYNSGFKWSVAASNRTYGTRWMMTYGSPWLKRHWKVNISASMRFAEEGYRLGTPYEAYSFLCSADKQFPGNHFVNITGILAQNRRGTASAMTDEVFGLKDSRYNPNWGYQGGVKRNARLKRSLEPIIQVNYKWNMKPDVILGAHLTCQWGSSGKSRLDYGGSRRLQNTDVIVGGGVNPDPSYYQNLPSYFLRNKSNKDFAGAFLAGQHFLNSGQINWDELYRSNQNAQTTGNSIYAQYEDRVENSSISFQGEIFRQLGAKLHLRFALWGKMLSSKRYAYMLDLLGGSGYLDVDPFETGTNEAQSDLRNPNRIVVEKERFKYNYKIDATDLSAFMRLDHRGRKEEAFIAFGLGSRNYRRTGLFENGSFPGSASYGKGPALNFSTFSLKAGYTYKISGRHMVQISGALMTQPPVIKDAYSNLRENHDPVIGLGESSLYGADFVYRMRMPRIQMSLGTYLSAIKGESRVNFYYADGLIGLDDSGTSAFVQEVRTGTGSLSMGAELGLQCTITGGLKLKGAAAMGIAYFTENPELYLTSDDLDEPVFYGPASLRGYRVPNGPQEALSIGLEYSDPDYWWLGISFNSFRKSFIQVAPVTRTKNFYTDPKGFLIRGYDESVASELLSQERLPDFNVVNLVGGKSWKIKKTYLGFFISVGNVLNAVHKTGGYEQSRNANYEALLEDRSREFPLFAPKYWYGYGTTFFTSVYVRTQ